MYSNALGNEIAYQLRWGRMVEKWFTEEIWLTCEDCLSLCRGLQTLVSDEFPGITARKAQLFEIASAQRVLHLISNSICLRTIELAENNADSPKGISPLNIIDEIMAELAEYGPEPDYLPRPPLDPITKISLELAANLADPEWVGAHVRNLGAWATELAAVASGASGSDPENGPQRLLLHDIFGNPFRPVTFDPGWQTSNVIDLARTIYEEKAFDHMPILADALMDAGCSNEEIIQHCRNDGPHVRGCWVIDLILGKE
jgi:hypothetical protein